MERLSTVLHFIKKTCHSVVKDSMHPLISELLTIASFWHTCVVPLDEKHKVDNTDCEKLSEFHDLPLEHKDFMLKMGGIDTSESHDVLEDELVGRVVGIKGESWRSSFLPGAINTFETLRRAGTANVKNLDQ